MRIWLFLDKSGWENGAASVPHYGPRDNRAGRMARVPHALQRRCGTPVPCCCKQPGSRVSSASRCCAPRRGTDAA